MPARARVVVIGGGHQGLVCAIRLARRGMAVTVLEHADRPGGGVASSSDTLPGFLHDTCSGFFPLTLASPSFDGLDVRQRIEWVNPPLAMAHPFLDGHAIVLHRDVGATGASLDATVPGAGAQWARLVGPLVARRRLVRRAALSPFPPVLPGAALALSLRREGVELARRLSGSAASFGRDLFGDPRATAWLCGSVSHSDLTPGSAGGAAFAFGLHLLAHLVGWGFPRGGAARLIDALVGRLVELGGDVRCRAHAERILVRDGTARGVGLASGEELRADAVVSAVSAAPLSAMVPDGALPPRLQRRLRTWRYGLGTFKVDFALAGPVPWTALEAREAGVVHLGDTLEALFRSPQAAGLGRAPREPAMVVGQHSLHDPTRAPAGRHTLYVYTRVPAVLDIADDEMADRIERRIEAFAPGFRGLVLARAIRSPQRLEHENPSMVGGDLGGGSMEIDQLAIFRPAPELVRGRTPLRGLYVAGPSVHPGAGVHGVSGTAAARAVLADMSPLRFWR